MASVLLIVAWLLPNHYPPWVNFHSEFLSFLGLGFLGVAWLWRSKQKASIPVAAIVLLSLVAIAWVQYAVGLIFYGGDAFISSLYGVGFVFAITLGYNYSLKVNSSAGDVWLLPSYVLLCAALASSFLAVMQWLLLTDSFSTFVAVSDIGDRATANLGQPNQLGTLLLMGLGALLLMFELNKSHRLILFLAMLLLTWGIVLSGSRTAMLSALVLASFLAYKVHVRRLSNRPMRLQIRHLLFWLVGFALAVISLPAVNAALLLDGDRAIGLLNDNGRITIWLQTLYGIFEAPWLGYGWNQTAAAQAVGALHLNGDLAFSNAHNIVLDLVAWVGIPLGLLVTAVFAYWLFKRVKSVQSTAAVCAMAMLLPVLVHSMLEFPFAYAYFLLAAGLLVGVIESSHVAISVYGITSRTLAAALALLAVVGIYSAYEYLYIEEDYRVARFENLRVGKTEADYVQPKIVIHTQLAALLATLRQPAVPGMDGAQLERLRKVSLRFGQRPLVFRYALALGLNGDAPGAAKQMQVFRAMYGDRAYQTFKLEFRVVQAEKYPELAAVILP